VGVRGTGAAATPVGRGRAGAGSRRCGGGGGGDGPHLILSSLGSAASSGSENHLESKAF